MLDPTKRDSNHHFSIKSPHTVSPRYMEAFRSKCFLVMRMLEQRIGEQLLIQVPYLRNECFILKGNQKTIFLLSPYLYTMSFYGLVIQMHIIIQGCDFSVKTLILVDFKVKMVILEISTGPCMTDFRIFLSLPITSLNICFTITYWY